MTTREDWAQREDLRLQLAELLKQEPLKSALEVCLSLDIGAPQTLNSSSDIIHQQALNGASREGYFKFFRNLNALSLKPKPTAEEPTPWAHVGKKK